MTVTRRRIADVLEQSRRELLDLTTRNRLIHTPRRNHRISQIEIVGERSDEVFRRLVLEGQSMAFRPAPRSSAEPGEGKAAVADPALAADPCDNVLQTTLDEAALSRRLLKLFYDARTFEEEQGVGILYLALGFLTWYETPHEELPRHAPLVLIPVNLTRSSVRSQFRVAYRGDDLETNLSLQQRLAHDFGIDLPDLPDADDLVCRDYFARVREAVAASQPRWEVRDDDIVLGFFSFSRLLMYRDLDAAQWPGERSLTEHPLVVSLLGAGFAPQPEPFSEEEPLDPHLPPQRCLHVVDADSSQAAVIEEVRRGSSLVIQGPPGTGKSQTITNLIAAAVHEGKRVLFVAEKMAALEVVQRRLTEVGLGPLCLELHSHKANKREVLAELGRTLQLGRPSADDAAQVTGTLSECLTRLNGHAQRMHAPLGASGLSLYDVLGELVRLREQGVRPPPFALGQAADWTPAQRAERRSALESWVDQFQRIASPQTHPWRGVRASGLLPTDGQRLAGQAGTLAARFQRLAEAGTQLAEALGCAVPQTTREVVQLAEVARRLRKAPPLDRAAFADEVWDHQRRAIDELVAHGQRLARVRRELDGIVTHQAWETDVAAARRELAAWGWGWLRWLSGRYRRAMRTLQGILAGPLPSTLEERLAILDRLQEGQQVRRAVEAGDELGRRAFGTLWRGTESDWAALEAICKWEQAGRQGGLPADFRQWMARWTGGDVVEAALRQVRTELAPLQQELKALIQTLDWDLPAVFSLADPYAVPLARWIAQLEVCQRCAGELVTWCAYHHSRQRVQELGLQEVLRAAEEGQLASTELLDQFDLAWCEALVRHAQAQFPELKLFDGAAHERLIEQFRQLDRQRQLLARQQVALAHWQRLPRLASDVGEVGLVRREIHKKRRHLPLRQLLKEAGRAVQQIKPVFLMSPLSVAQFLAPGAVEFDLLVIDEASQVRPVDALGAIARVRQMVVVGDDRQLPPTRFFSRLAADGDAEADEEASLRTGDLESILGLCVAAGLPSRMLRWHYRSRHPSLIAVSNREFYEGRLLVVPSPQASGEPFGLRFHYLDQAVYDRGGTATNRLEAAAVAEAVLDFARRYPDQSLGVGTFSVAQRDAILDALEERRRQHPELEPFFAAGPEPFFVKNLENIQGDERDVIFISVGYARDERGVLSMNFGPLTTEGGHRRLNVLITRARQRCEVFSAITADDIDLRRTDAWGVRALKAFLQFARNGQVEAAGVGSEEDQALLERQVAQAVRQMGYEVVSLGQESRFFLDMAVVDPQQPQRYLLGIQCDGAAYRAARWARDRDRLRQEILEQRGWRMHRLWSLDWFRQPQRELNRLAEAIQQARQASALAEALSHGATESSPRPFPVPDPQPPGNAADLSEGWAIHRHAVQDHPAIAAIPYAVTTLTLRAPRPFPDLPTSEQVRIIRQIVQTEGPIHADEICQRAATLTGMQRAGSRVKESVGALLVQGQWQGWLVASDDFYSLPGQPSRLRDRSEAPSSTLRSPAMVPPDELAAAIVAVVQTSVGATPDEIVREVARLLGVKQGPALREALDRQFTRLAQSGRLQWQAGRWTLAPTGRQAAG